MHNYLGQGKGFRISSPYNQGSTWRQPPPNQYSIVKNVAAASRTLENAGV